MVNISTTEWTYAEEDPKAVGLLEKRIAETGRRQDLITYSDLVKGIQFSLPNVNGGRPYQIDVQEWQPLDRAIIGDFLGYISARSYQRAQFMASALVVNQEEHLPSDHFIKWMQEIGALTSSSESAKLKFWSDEVRKAHQYFTQQPPP